MITLLTAFVLYMFDAGTGWWMAWTLIAASHVLAAIFRS
jgi:hypothetical protein